MYFLLWVVVKNVEKPELYNTKMHNWLKTPNTYFAKKQEERKEITSDTDSFPQSKA